jgi:hypothetical protein
MSEEYQLIQFEGCTVAVIAPEDLGTKDAEIDRLRGLLDRAEDALLEMDSHTHIQSLLDDIHAALSTAVQPPSSEDASHE